MIGTFTEEELCLLEEMFDALSEGFEYFTEENEETFSSIKGKLEGWRG